MHFRFEGLNASWNIWVLKCRCSVWSNMLRYRIKGSIHVMLGSVGPLKISYISFFLRSHLQKSFGPWSPGLEHDGEDGEDDDLDGGATSVPVWSADSILQQKKDWSVYIRVRCAGELCIAFGALLTRLHVAWYCWCLQCLICARVCRLWASAGKGLTCRSSNNSSSSSSSSSSQSCCAGHRSCRSFHSGNSPPLGPTYSRLSVPPAPTRLRPPERNLLLLSNVYNDPTSSSILPSFLKCYVPRHRRLCDKSVNPSDLIWPKKKHQGFNNPDTRDARSKPPSSYPKKHVAMSLPSVCV